MTAEFFFSQWERLVNKFGPKNMDPELKQLVANEIMAMSEVGFQRVVEIWIGSKLYKDPPRLAEFREAYLKEQKYKLQNEAKQAAAQLKKAPEEMQEHMRSILMRNFGSAKTVGDALNVAIKKNRNGDNGT